MFFIKIVKSILLFLATLVLWLFGAFFIPTGYDDSKNNCESKMKMWVVSHGIHVAFIFPEDGKTMKWNQFFQFEREYDYFELAWGDSAYYTHDDPGTKEAFAALFYPTSSVMYVRGHSISPEERFDADKLVELQVCPEQLNIMSHYAMASFSEDLRVVKDQGTSSRFFASKHSYHALETCNTWVAKGLREAGIRTPLWSGTSASVMYHLRR